jgi:hypothetical protein
MRDYKKMLILREQTIQPLTRFSIARTKQIWVRTKVKIRIKCSRIKITILIKKKRLSNRSIYWMRSLAIKQLDLSSSNLTCFSKKHLSLTTTISSINFSTAHPTSLQARLQVGKHLTKNLDCSITTKFQNSSPNISNLQTSSISSKLPKFSSGRNQTLLLMYYKTQTCRTIALEFKTKSLTSVNAHKETFSRQDNQIYSKIHSSN